MLRSPSGYSSSSADHIEGAVNNCLRGLDRSRCLVVTSGARWTGRQPSFPGAKVLQIDCRHFHDPDSDRSIRGCTGRHPSIIRGVALHEAMNDLVEQVTDFLRANPNGKLVIHLYCTSGRHRSVGLAALIYYFLDVTDWRKPLLIHYHSPEWREMTCGGHCSLCATADTRELGNLMNRHLPDVRVVDVDEPDRAYYNGDEIYPHVDTIQDCASSSPCMFQHIHLQAVVLETHLVEEHITKETNEAVIMEDKTDQKKILFERQAWSAISKQPPIRRPCDESQRQRLERELRDILNDNSGDPYCWNVDEDILSWIISSAKLWGNRDRVIWITDPSLPHEEQQQQGIRVDIKLRSHVRSTLISGGKWMNRQGWVKSSFYRPRDSAGTLWNRLQREEAVGENVDLPTTWADLVIFSHRDVRPRAYTGRVVLLSGDQGFEGSIAPKTGPQNAPKTEPQNAPKTEPQKSQKYVPKTKVHLQSRKNPPTPPQPSRFMICTDDDMFKGNPKIQTPKDESTDYSTSSSDESPVAKPVKSKSSNGKPCHEKTPKDEVIIKTEPGDVLPVGLMARDPDGPNMHEVVLDSDTDVEVHEHGPIAIQPNERVTMGRKHRKAVLDGIANLNKNDMMIQSGLGLISNPNRDSKTVVFTSHPFVFVQESGQPSVDVIDVGVGASHLDPEFDPKDFCNLLEGYQNIVIAIGYNNPNDPLGHGRFLAEVELMCDLDNCKFLHIDVAMTDRWEKHQHPQTPYINDHGLAFTCNDEQWTHEFESWFRGQTMDDVLSWKFADWIGSWAKEDDLNHQMGIAFVGDMHEEAHEEHQRLDALWDSDDRAQVNPVEELISEETLIDEVEIPGLPQDEVERRKQWKKLPARVRIAVRRLHRQFGHVPRQTMIHLLRAARVRTELLMQ
ncbi:unnamed protein product [Cladocopium goreaui]|uniref:RapZ C-terminal domain-containing protein n=1 Tax=Cladocopium goreaui TaxID=2562237 RepID=A0A9P1CM72_9DINO|nr:unnamed protein product [Cladocopium goreaui]